PVEFARRQVSAGDDDLQHVQRDQHHHRLRAEVVQAADQPAEVHLVLDGVNAIPGLRAGRTVGGHQHDAGDELNAENEHETAAPDVAPASAAGDAFEQHGADQFPHGGAM